MGCREDGRRVREERGDEEREQCQVIVCAIIFISSLFGRYVEGGREARIRGRAPDRAEMSRHGKDVPCECACRGLFAWEVVAGAA